MVVVREERDGRHGSALSLRLRLKCAREVQSFSHWPDVLLECLTRGKTVQSTYPISETY